MKWSIFIPNTLSNFFWQLIIVFYTKHESFIPHRSGLPYLFCFDFIPKFTPWTTKLVHLLLLSFEAHTLLPGSVNSMLCLPNLESKK